MPQKHTHLENTEEKSSMKKASKNSKSKQSQKQQTNEEKKVEEKCNPTSKDVSNASNGKSLKKSDGSHRNSGSVTQETKKHHSCNVSQITNENNGKLKIASQSEQDLKGRQVNKVQLEINSDIKILRTCLKNAAIAHQKEKREMAKEFKIQSSIITTLKNTIAEHEKEIATLHVKLKKDKQQTKQKTEENANLQRQLRDMKTSFEQQLEEMERTVQELETKEIPKLRNQLSNMTNNFTQQAKENKKNQELQQELQLKVNSLELTLKNTVDEKEEKIATLCVQLKEDKQQTEQKTKENANLQRQLREITTSYKEQLDEKERKMQELETKKIPKLRDELSTMANNFAQQAEVNKKNHELQQDLQLKLKSAKLTLKNTINEKEEKIATLYVKLKEDKVQTEQKTKENANLQRQLRDMKTSYEKQLEEKEEKIQELVTKEMPKLRDKLSTMTNNLAQETEENKKNQKLQQELQLRINSIELENKKYQQELNAFYKDIKDKMSRNRKTIAQLYDDQVQELQTDFDNKIACLRMSLVTPAESCKETSSIEQASKEILLNNIETKPKTSDSGIKKLEIQLQEKNEKIKNLEQQLYYKEVDMEKLNIDLELYRRGQQIDVQANAETSSGNYLPHEVMQEYDEKTRNLITASMKKIEEIEMDTKNLETQVSNFSGSLECKEYLFLEEMLIRNLVKLDNVDSEGLKEIRSRRKNVLQYVQRIIEVLKSKATK